MNSLERSLVTKAGYDHGWEVVIDETAPAFLVLGSANHRAQTTVRAAGGGGWIVQFPAGRLTSELSRVVGLRRDGGGGVAAANERELGALLAHASRLARTLPDLPCRRYERAVSDELARVAEGPTATEVERIVRQRVGQDIYRESLLDYWGGACAVTGIELPELLRASHAKRWADCASDAERLDVFNGFLLAAHLDALFDRYLLTFDLAGLAVLSPRVDATTRGRLGLTHDLRLRWLSPEHETYLAVHREEFTRQTSVETGFSLCPSSPRLNTLA